MNERGLKKLYWGFLFIMLSIRFNGIDILPDIIGYILFAQGFKELENRSSYFIKAEKYNIPLIILSIFSIYQIKINMNDVGSMVHSPLIPFVMAISIATFVLDLLVVYNLFMGIKEIMEQQEASDLIDESNSRWNEYFVLKIATMFSFFFVYLPLIATIYITIILVLSIIILIKIMGFIKRCDDNIGDVVIK